MESDRRSSSRVKDRLARMFRSPSLLRSTCNTSSSAASRCIINDAAPALEARRGDDDSLGLGRSLSFPLRKDLDTLPSVVGLRRRLSVDCRLRQSRPPPPPPPTTTTTEKKKEERAPASSCFSKAMEEEDAKEGVKSKRKKLKKNKKNRLLSNGYGFSSSSSAESGDDGDDAEEFFSSEDEGGGGERKEADETSETTFLSSRSFSSYSSEFYQNPKNKKKKPHHPPARRSDRPARKHEGWGVCRGLRPPAVVPLSSSAAAEHRRREEEIRRKRGFAVVKRSRDPYNDFRSSMVEMIMERQIFGARDLENLLRSYLCLNPPHLHLVILQAFSDIWVVLFGH